MERRTKRAKRGTRARKAKVRVACVFSLESVSDAGICSLDRHLAEGTMYRIESTKCTRIAATRLIVNSLVHCYADNRS